LTLRRASRYQWKSADAKPCIVQTSDALFAQQNPLVIIPAIMPRFGGCGGSLPRVQDA